MSRCPSLAAYINGVNPLNINMIEIEGFFLNSLNQFIVYFIIYTRVKYRWRETGRMREKYRERDRERLQERERDRERLQERKSDKKTL